MLAVSGGLDSMVLLTSTVNALGPGRVSVVTFDHGTGAAASRAARLVRTRGDQLRVDVVTGRAPAGMARSEAAWRNARWAFLRGEAWQRGATLATAHTRDDQIETVLMRLLRGAGVRGLAALEARSDVKRPLLTFARRDLRDFAVERHLEWIDDPTNDSLEFFRNRVRHEILPALRQVWPEVDETLVSTGRSAAAWRTEVEDLVTRSFTTLGAGAQPQLDVLAADLEGHSEESLCIVWPVLLQRIGVIADRRAIARLASFSRATRRGARIQISGGWQVARSQTFFHVRPLEAV